MDVMEDIYADVRKTESRARAQIEAHISELQGKIALGQQSLVLKTSPGWDQFVRLVEAQLERRKEEVVVASDDRETAILQGRCREITAILGLMRETENTVKNLNDLLQSRLADRDKRFSDGIVKPIGAVL